MALSVQCTSVLRTSLLPCPVIHPYCVSQRKTARALGWIGKGSAQRDGDNLADGIAPSNCEYRAKSLAHDCFISSQNCATDGGSGVTLAPPPSKKICPTGADIRLAKPIGYPVCAHKKRTCCVVLPYRTASVLGLHRACKTFALHCLLTIRIDVSHFPAALWPCPNGPLTMCHDRNEIGKSPATTLRKGINVILVQQIKTCCVWRLKEPWR